METKTTSGISVSVSTKYLPDYSSPLQQHFVFAYTIVIQNFGSQTVQLTRRFWNIFDADGSLREVEGEGVVGQQPILAPGESHQYISGCNLKTEIGKMAGYYTFERLADATTFRVSIPEFILAVPYKLN